MGNYGIMRTEKCRRTAVAGLQKENNRQPGDEFVRSDIDKDRTHENEYLIKTNNWNKEITRQIKETGVKEKSNSVVMIDGFYGASSEWFSNHSQDEWEHYFKDCLDFHIEKFCKGDKNRVLNAVIHYDEATPHLHITSVPVFRDKKGWHLSAKTIAGNNKAYSRRQDEFYEQVSKKYGLERGEKRDPKERRKHLSVQEYKKQQNEKQLQEQETQLAARRDELKAISPQEPSKRKIGPFSRGYDKKDMEQLEEQAAYGRDAIIRERSINDNEERQRKQAEELTRRQEVIDNAVADMEQRKKLLLDNESAVAKNAELLSQREKELDAKKKEYYKKAWDLNIQRIKQEKLEKEQIAKTANLNEREGWIKRYEKDNKDFKTWQDHVTAADKKEAALLVREKDLLAREKEVQETLAAVKLEKEKYEELSHRKYFEIKHKTSRSR